MSEDAESSSPPLPEDVDGLKAIVLDLRKREKQILQEKKQVENDFGKKRAMLKGMFISKEEELEVLRKRYHEIEAEAKKTQAKLDEVVNECDTLRTAAAVLESTQKEEINSINSKYQEELASLQHIMREAIKEARDTTAQQFELERHSLISANQKLDAQVKELHAKLGHDGKNTGVMSAMTDAVAGVVRRTSSHPSTGYKEKGPDKNMEEGMKKAQEDAEAWKAIVKPLEEENSFLKSKLKAAEVKLRGVENLTTNKESGLNMEELQEKVKELNQYLESERASRTDLEMYVAVLNTQKGVLQEDSDKLRKELHNVCRLLEQEKTAHRELKQTWQMANDQFLENQQMQNSKMTMMWNIMTHEQKQRVKEQRQKLVTTRPQTGELVDVSTPPLTPVSSVEKATDVALTIPDSGSHLSDISTLSCTNSFTSIASDKDESNDEEEEGDNKQRSRARSHSDSGSLEVADIDVSRAKSADNLSPPPSGVQDKLDADAIRHSPLLDLEPRPRTPSKGKIDWRVFQEEVKVLHQSETNRSCVMCSNYEKQLQKVEAERQKLKNLSSNLQIALEHEKKALFEEQKLRSRLEQSVANAGQDAQTQINEQADMLNKLDKILVDVQRNYGATRKEASAQIEKLTVSRDELKEELNRLRSEYSALQDSALQQLSQMDTDARVTEMKEQLMQIRSASEGMEEKLRSEIAFLKDRAIAEQMNKDSMEEMLQADVESCKMDIGKLAEDLKKERKEKQEVETKLQQSDQMLRNIEAKSKTVIIALRGQLEEASEEKKKLEDEMKRLKNQFQSLTSQLNESETVQRDFVKLSQSLQMQIAKIQESEEDVRWEHKDDVHQCHKCNKPLANNKDKAHCHHCCKIFCEACRSKTINSSVTRRAHQVCDLCHAILSKDPNALVNDVSDGDR